MIVFNVFFKSKIGLITMRIQDLYLPLYIVWGEDENQEALLPFYTLERSPEFVFAESTDRDSSCDNTMVINEKYSLSIWSGCLSLLLSVLSSY